MLFKNIIALIVFTSIIYCQTSIDSSQSLHKKSVRQIIFWGPSPAELDSMNNEDTEVYSDYYYYASKSSKTLKGFGIELKDTTSYLININYDNNKTEIFKRRLNSIAYIFNDGIQKPEIIKAVMTDTDIILKAKEFFQIK